MDHRRCVLAQQGESLLRGPGLAGVLCYALHCAVCGVCERAAVSPASLGGWRRTGWPTDLQTGDVVIFHWSLAYLHFTGLAGSILPHSWILRQK